MQENKEEDRIKKWEQVKHSTGRSVTFVWQNPVCSIPCATGCCSVIFVVSAGIVFVGMYFLIQY
jgi:hypothetical protein